MNKLSVFLVKNIPLFTNTNNHLFNLSYNQPDITIRKYWINSLSWQYLLKQNEQTQSSFVADGNKEIEENN